MLRYKTPSGSNPHKQLKVSLNLCLIRKRSPRFFVSPQKKMPYPDRLQHYVKY